MATAVPAEQEILELENSYWQAVKDRDIDAAVRLTDDPCLLAGAQGAAQVEVAKLPQMMQSAKYTLHSFELKDAHVRLMSADVALTVYNVHEELTVDGKPVSMDAANASACARRGEHWVCA